MYWEWFRKKFFFKIKKKSKIIVIWSHLNLLSRAAICVGDEQTSDLKWRMIKGDVSYRAADLSKIKSHFLLLATEHEQRNSMSMAYLASCAMETN